MPGRTDSERKLPLDDAPTELATSYAPAVMPGVYAPRLRLFWLPTLTQRHQRWLVDWDEWVRLARDMGLTIAVNDRGFARVCWRDRDAFEANREAVAFLRNRGPEGSL